MFLAVGGEELVLFEKFGLGEEEFFVEFLEFELEVFLGSSGLFQLQFNGVGRLFSGPEFLFDGFVVVLMAGDDFFVVAFLPLGFGF